MGKDRPRFYADLREDSPTFGAVAVKLPAGSSLGDYGVMTLDRGGSYPRANRVEPEWTELVPVTELQPVTAELVDHHPPALPAGPTE